MISKKLLSVAVALAGCSSLDADVRPTLTQATISVDRSLPDEPAVMEWVVGFETDLYAEREVSLEQVAIIGELDAEPFAHDLEMAFPQDFDGHVECGSEPTLHLVNQNVTNGELEFLCDQDVVKDLVAFVQVSFSEGAERYQPFSTEPYQVECL